MKPILYEDDCAPDAREYFEKDLLKITHMNIREFIDTGSFEEKDNGMTLTWQNAEFILEYSGDDPYYRLYRL
jgi:hypothetical protein